MMLFFTIDVRTILYIFVRFYLPRVEVVLTKCPSKWLMMMPMYATRDTRHTALCPVAVSPRVPLAGRRAGRAQSSAAPAPTVRPGAWPSAVPCGARFSI